MKLITGNLPLLIEASQVLQKIIGEMLKISGVDDTDKDVIKYKKIQKDLTEIIEAPSQWDQILFDKAIKKNKVAEVSQTLIDFINKFLRNPQEVGSALSLASFVNLCHIARDLQNPANVKEIYHEVMKHQTQVSDKNKTC